jgi:hypothetical protein
MKRWQCPSKTIQTDTWVNATTFIHTSSAHLQGPGGSHSTWLGASQGTMEDKACAPQGSPTKQSVHMG